MVGPHRPEPCHAVVDDDAEVTLEHVVDAIVEQHRWTTSVAALDQPAGEQVARQHHRLALGRPHPLDHQDVLARLQLQQGRLAGRGRLDPGARSSAIPAVMPAARMASVTPKFTSRLLAMRGWSATKVPEPWRAPEEPLQLHGPQGLAQGRPRHPELGGQLWLGGQLGPGGELSPVDPLLELVLDRDRA